MINLLYVFGVFSIWILFTLYIAPLRNDPYIYQFVSYIPSAKIRFLIWSYVYISLGYFMTLIGNKEAVGPIVWWMMGGLFLILFTIQYLAHINYNIRVILILLLIAIFLVNFISTDYSFSSFDTSEDIFAIDLLTTVTFWLMFLFGSLLALIYLSERDKFIRKRKRNV